MNHLFFDSRELDGLSRGLLWGDDALLGSSTREAFRIIGASHFLAASGANLAALQGLLGWVLPKNTSTWLLLGVGAILGMYSLGVNESSLWRAYACWCLVFLAKVFGRKSFFPWMLGVIVCVGALLSPELIQSIGFQLSGAAVMGLYFSQKILPSEKINAYMNDASFLRLAKRGIVTSTIVSLFVAPISYFYFQKVSWLSPIATFILGPVMSVLFFFSLLREALSTLRAVGWYSPSLLIEPAFVATTYILGVLVESLLYVAGNRLWMGGAVILCCCCLLSEMWSRKSGT